MWLRSRVWAAGVEEKVRRGHDVEEDGGRDVQEEEDEVEETDVEVEER